MKRYKKNELSFHIMLFPGMVFLILFNIVPMFGVVMAFQNYIPTKGIMNSKWVGLDNFSYLFELPESIQAVQNTVIIAVAKIVASLIIPLIFALALNTIRKRGLKKASQTIVYLPFFLSWVILSSTIQNLLDLKGPINQMISGLGGEPIHFLISNTWFQPILVITDTWKNLGYNTVIFMAAILGIDPGLYEAAEIDGASKWKQLWNVTLPGIMSTIVLLATLSLGSVLNAGFDQVFNMYNPLVYLSGDIIDTYVYRLGLVQAQFGLATAVGLFKSAVSFFLILLSYKLAAKYANYRIF